MRVWINPHMCDGHARCTGVAPDIFAIGSDGKAFLKTQKIAPEMEALVLRAERGCPMQAIVTLPDKE